MYRNLYILGLLLFLTASCKEKKEEQVILDLLLTNLHLVDVKNDTILRDRMIGIRNDTIRLVSAHNEVQSLNAKRTIDLKGQYVMPGLWDMHVHFRGGEELIQENKDLLPLFLAYGITTVRDAGGDMSKEVLNWRRDIKGGVLYGPRIFSSGPKLDGDKPAWPGSLNISSEKDVKKALDSLESLEVDYVKFYDGSLDKTLYYETLRQAENRGLKTTGHMPLSANIEDATRFGLNGSEHLYYLMKSCSPKADSLTQANPRYSMFNEVVKTYDPAIANQLFEMLASKGFYVTPTLHISKVLSEMLDTDHESDSLKKYVGEGIQKSYGMRIERAKKAREQGSETRNQVFDRGMKMIVPMQKAGLSLLAGSDSGASNSYVYPGESLLGELEMLVEAGLSPAEALKTSIVNGPAFFELQDYYGSVEEGKVGDLIVLKENPLEQIDHLSQLNWLIRKGEAYSKQELLSKLKVSKN